MERVFEKAFRKKGIDMDEDWLNIELAYKCAAIAVIGVGIIIATALYIFL